MCCCMTVHPRVNSLISLGLSFPKSEQATPKLPSCSSCAETGRPETVHVVCWAPVSGLSALQPDTPQVDWGLDVTGPASHRNARVGPRGWGRSMRPLPQGREPDL